jgi:hypothetical protein
MRNHDRPFRPLRAGTAVFNPNVGVLGTLGLVATSDGIDRWIVSCYHVLGRADGGPFQDNEPVMQGDLVNPVARVSVDRASGQLDCVAALVDPLIDAVGEVLGVPPVQAPIQPVAGMRVLKSGRETGITEGVIRSVAGKDVVIRVPLGFPNDYELSGIGDSGAVWMTEAGQPVALHRAGNPATREAFAFDISAVLAALGLTVI